MILVVESPIHLERLVKEFGGVCKKMQFKVSVEKARSQW